MYGKVSVTKSSSNQFYAPALYAPNAWGENVFTLIFLALVLIRMRFSLHCILFNLTTFGSETRFNFAFSE